MFSKNEDNKHESLHSKQELSAYKATTATKLKSPGRCCDSARGLVGRRALDLSGKLQELKGDGPSAPATRRRERPGLRITAEAVGVFLLGGYIQTHPKLMDLYTYMYTKACYSLFVETTTSTSGSWMPTFVPLSLLEEEDSRDFLEAKDTPLPCNLPASSSLPVTS